MLLSQFMIIISSQKEAGDSIAATLESNSSVCTLTADNFSDGYDLINKYEPDLILIQDNFENDVTEICRELRSKTKSFRPVIVVLSKNNCVDKKLEILESGADDIQNETIDPKELSYRIFAHLRRHIEELTDPVTKLPEAGLSYRVLKRNIEKQSLKEYALMYIDINNFEAYREIYGYIASEKLLQTFIAIVKTALNEDDFLGKVSNNNFTILTSSEKSEKIAIFLTYSFDMVSQKFYTNEDVNRGYLISQGDEKIGRRIPFVSLSIGITSNTYKTFDSLEDLMNNAISVHRLAKTKTGSFWVSDRPKLAGSEIFVEDKKTILIVENDAALSYLLMTTLEMRGYNVESISCPDQTLETIEKISPDLVVFDTGKLNSKKELEICKEIKQKHSNIKVIVSTVECNKEQVLDTGADLYIPKPYELMILFSWISRLLNYEFSQ